jgi:Spy/CpxP family protein refolding chaperone
MIRMSHVWALALAAAVTTAAGPAMAQGQGQGRGFRGPQGLSILRLPMTLETRLNLNADQKTKIGVIRDRVRGELQGLFGQNTDREAAVAKLRETNQKAEAEATALLDATQKKQYDDLKAEARNYEGLGDAGIAVLSVSDLNGDQKAKLKEAATAAAAKRPQQGQGTDRQAARAARQAFDEANRATVKAILTAGQQTQFDAAIQAQRQRRPGGNNNN